MALSTKTFTVLVQDAVTAVQGAALSLIDFTVGSVLRAVVEAAAAMGLWLQGIALQTVSMARFSTSIGADADSWAADFSFARLAAQAAEGSVTFTRFSGTTQVVIPIGSQVQSQDGSQVYNVIADTTQSAYSSVQGGYVMAPNTLSITATVSSVSEASGGNVAAGAINTFTQTLIGVDAVTNPLAFDNGADPESDASYKSRFPAYIAGLSKATNAAISSAIENVQQGIAFSITENQNQDGSAHPGYFFVTVDDGSGNPSSDFLNTVANAIESVRGSTTGLGVFGPTLVTATVTLSLTLADGYDRNTIDALVTTAIQNYIGALTIGETLPYTRLSQLAYDASPGITNVTNVFLNGGVSDVVATSQNVIRAGAIQIS